MEKLHRASDNAAVTLSGQRGVILRSSAKIPHKIVGEDGRPQTITVDSFTYHPSISADAVTLVWNNPKGLVVIDRSIADFLLIRKWASEVSDEAFDWWNDKVAELENAAKEPKASEPTPATPEPPKAPEPVKQPEPPVTPKAPEPPKEPEKPAEPPKPAAPAPAAPKPPAPKPAAPAPKPAATKEDLLKRAEEEAAKLAGEGDKKPVTD